MAQGMDRKSPATERAYAFDWQIFAAWCDAHDLTSLPAKPETVAAFLREEMQGHVKPQTVARRTAAVRHFHVLERHEPPTNTELVRETMRDLRARYGLEPVIRKLPITPDVIYRLLPHCPDGLPGLRVRAFLGLGYATALHCTELVTLKTDTFEATPSGLRWRRNRIIRDVGWLTPVRWYLEWVQAVPIVSGWIFVPIRKDGVAAADRPISGNSAARALKAVLSAAGYDQSMFSVDSIRRGRIVSDAARGATAAELKQTAQIRCVAAIEATLMGHRFGFAPPRG